MKELQGRLEKKGWKLERDRLVRDLDPLKEIEIATAGKDVIIRNELRGDTGKVFQAAGVPSSREAGPTEEWWIIRTSSQLPSGTVVPHPLPLLVSD